MVRRCLTTGGCHGADAVRARCSAQGDAASHVVDAVNAEGSGQHSPQYPNYWAPLPRQRHHQEHRPQRPSESSDLTQQANGQQRPKNDPRNNQYHPQCANYWALTRKRQPKEHGPQRPSEHSTRREDQVQGPVNKPQLDGMSHRGGCFKTWVFFPCNSSGRR